MCEVLPMVGDTGFEPVTPAVSRQISPVLKTLNCTGFGPQPPGGRRFHPTPSYRRLPRLISLTRTLRALAHHCAWIVTLPSHTMCGYDD